jgi:hypothetical protein
MFTAFERHSRTLAHNGVLFLDGWFAVRRGLPVSPVPGLDSQSAHPMHVQAASRAVENEVLQLTFEVGLHLQELESEHLRVDGDRMIASTGSLRLVNELVGLRRLLGDGVNGVLEDVALSAHMVGGSAFGRERNVFECADRLIPILARLLGRRTRTTSAIRAWIGR